RPAAPRASWKARARPWFYPAPPRPSRWPRVRSRAGMRENHDRGIHERRRSRDDPRRPTPRRPYRPLGRAGRRPRRSGRPGPHGPVDVLPYRPDDPYLAPAYTVTDEADEDHQQIWELGLGRVRVLSLEGRNAAAERWYFGDRGPTGEEALHAAAPCSTCGYFVP